MCESGAFFDVAPLNIKRLDGYSKLIIELSNFQTYQATAQPHLDIPVCLSTVGQFSKPEIQQFNVRPIIMACLDLNMPPVTSKPKGLDPFLQIQVSETCCTFTQLQAIPRPSSMRGSGRIQVRRRVSARGKPGMSKTGDDSGLPQRCTRRGAHAEVFVLISCILMGLTQSGSYFQGVKSPNMQATPQDSTRRILVCEMLV